MVNITHGYRFDKTIDKIIMKYRNAVNVYFIDSD